MKIVQEKMKDLLLPQQTLLMFKQDTLILLLETLNTTPKGGQHLPFNWNKIEMKRVYLVLVNAFINIRSFLHQLCMQANSIEILNKKMSFDCYYLSLILGEYITVNIRWTAENVSISLLNSIRCFRYVYDISYYSLM